MHVDPLPPRAVGEEVALGLPVLHRDPPVVLVLHLPPSHDLGLGARRTRQLRRLLRENPSATMPALPRALAWVRATVLGLRAVRGPIYWGVLTAAGLLVSALGYSTQFAEPNAFIPGVCFGAAFLAVALPDSCLRQDDLAGVLGLRRTVESLGLVLIALQLVFTYAPPMHSVLHSSAIEARRSTKRRWMTSIVESLCESVYCNMRPW